MAPMGADTNPFASPDDHLDISNGNAAGVGFEDVEGWRGSRRVGPAQEEVAEGDRQPVRGDAPLSAELPPTTPQPKRKMRLREGVRIPVYGSFTWGELWRMAITWLSEPLNIALVVWLFFAGIDTVILVMLEIGLLDSAIPNADTRTQWVEDATQVLNALFVLMNAVWQPVFVYHVYQLCRYRPKDRHALQQYYCRGGHQKPKQWTHMLILVVLLHLMCFSMYALAIIYWAYPRSSRPTSAVIITLIGAYLLPVVAFLYFILCPLQRDYKESENPNIVLQEHEFREKHMVFSKDGLKVTDPEWQGGLVLGACDNPRVAFLTCLFPCPIFGINMARLGFGNKYLQAVTFLLVIVGPMLVFELAAHEVKGWDTRHAIAAIGLLLAFLGLFYGALWRMKMRSTYHLPAARWCCWSGGLTDCMQWLFCPWCALCQEVRTAEHYKIVEVDDSGRLILDNDLEAGNGNGGSPEAVQQPYPPSSMLGRSTLGVVEGAVIDSPRVAYGQRETQMTAPQIMTPPSQMDLEAEPASDVSSNARKKKGFSRLEK